MEIKKFKEQEYSVVSFHSLYGDMRMDSDYYDPFYIRNHRALLKKGTQKVKDFMNKPQYGLSIAMNEEGVGYKILKMDDIENILAKDEKAKYADISDKIFKPTKLKKYDVLFNRVNSDEYVGRTGIYLLDGNHTFASYLVRITSDKPYQNCYLTAFLNCKYGYHVLQRVKRRAVNQANINAQELKDLEIPFPTRQFQEKIQSLIEESFELLKSSKSQYNEAEQSFLEEIGLSKWTPQRAAFKIGNTEHTTDETVNIVSSHEALNHNRFDSEYYQLKFDKLYEFIKKQESSKGFTLSTLGSFVEYKKGIEVGSKSYIDSEEVPFLRVSNFNRYGLDFQGCKYISYSDYADLKKNFQPQIGEILFSKDGTAGMAYQLREQRDAIISGGILRLQNISKLPTSYIELVLNSLPIQYQVEQLTNGALIHHLKVNVALKMYFPVVNNPEHYASLLDKSFDSYIKSNKLLAASRKVVEDYIEFDETIAINKLNDFLAEF